MIRAGSGPEWGPLIGPDQWRNCALIGGTLLCRRRGLWHYKWLPCPERIYDRPPLDALGRVFMA